MLLSDGTKLQHTTPVTSDGRQISGNTVVGERRMNGLMHRAVVISVTYPDEADKTKDNKPGEESTAKFDTDVSIRRTITCDVIAYGMYGRVRPLTGVPVMQMRHGIHNHTTWVPRASSIDLSGDNFHLQPSEENDFKSSNFGNLDGDHVLIQYLDDDHTQPIIVGALAHPHAKYVASSEEGEVYRIEHAGTLIKIDKNGNVEIDATNANTQELDKEGNPVEVTGGTITFKTVEDETINLSVGNADDNAVRYSELKKWADDLILFLTNLKVQTAVGTSSVPINLPAPPFEDIIKSNKVTIPSE